MTNKKQKANEKQTPIPVKRRRARNQTGSIYERSGAFYVRFYTRDREGRPVQKSEFLCQKSNKYDKLNCKGVKDLRDTFMRKINSGVRPGGAVLITDYWKDEYLKYIGENKRASTVEGYEQLWESVLADHFAGRVLQEYKKHNVNEFLLSLANKKKDDGTPKYGLRTLNHIRWCASGMFEHALNIKGLLEVNPWHGDSSIFVNVEEPEEHSHYTLAEAMNVIAALESRPEEQLVMMFACFAGLRNSEIRGLKWEDFRDGRVYVTRGFLRGVEGPLKRKSSKRSVPIIPQLGVALNAWHVKSGNPTTGWVFPNEKGDRPINLRDRARNHIIPMLEKAGIEWKAFHAGRHCLGTLLTELTGTTLASKEALGHATQAITDIFYTHKTENTQTNAFGLLEAAVDAIDAKKNGSN